MRETIYMVSEKIIEAAEGGDPEAQYQLGLIYLYGNDEPRDPAKAAQWFAKSSDQGFLPARRELGILLVSGEGVEKNLETGVQYLGQAADNLDPSALYHLGAMYEKGIGVEEDVQKAVRMYAYAAQLGYPGADLDADRLDQMLTAERNKRLRARPLLKLQLSNVDVEAACCKPMLDRLLAQDIIFTDTATGPALLGEDQYGMDAVFYSCPFCGAKIEYVPRDKKY